MLDSTSPQYLAATSIHHRGSRKPTGQQIREALNPMDHHLVEPIEKLERDGIVPQEAVDAACRELQKGTSSGY